MRRYFPILIALLVLPSCSQVGALASKLKPGKKDDNFGKIPPIPKEVGGPGTIDTFDADAPENRVVAIGVDPATLSLTQGGVEGLAAESELIFTDPDDVEASEAALKGIIGNKKTGWLESHSFAKKQALVESKPLLVLFTNSNGSSPAVNRLEGELLARLDFAEWADENLVRLRLDFNVKNRQSTDTTKQSLALRQEKYLRSLKKRYKISGFPVMLMIANDGSVIQKVRGYNSGNYEYVWGLLRTAVELNEERRLKFEEKLSKKGYRRWRGKNDLLILARLVSYKDGTLLLIEPNGVRHQTEESNLSAEDRRWIKKEKEKRELE